MNPRGVLTATTLRVALSATGITAIMLLVASLVIDVGVHHALVSNIDNRIAGFVNRAQGGPMHQVPPESGYQSVVDVPISIWVFDQTGSLIQKTRRAPDIGSPQFGSDGMQTIHAQGSSFRVMPLRAGPDDSQVVVGESLSTVDRETETLIRTELLVAPVILLLVFGGSLAVGRRVGRPIEAARQKQLAFTADASHELRTPLSVIEAETALALGKKRSVAEYHDVLMRVSQESGRLRNIVESLLWLARFDAAPQAPADESLDLGALVESSRDRFAAIAVARNLNLSIDPPGEPVLLTAPPEWLDRLTGVLIDNACRYTPSGGSVRVTVISEKATVGLRVEDSGPGVSDAERAQIFDRFHRATTGEDGTGLGLAIGDAIVRATGGAWHVARSDALGGASFSVTWPRRH